MCGCAVIHGERSRCRSNDGASQSATVAERRDRGRRGRGCRFGGSGDNPPFIRRVCVGRDRSPAQYRSLFVEGYASRLRDDSSTGAAFRWSPAEGPRGLLVLQAGPGKVGLLTTGFPGTPSMTADQIKLCFYSGVLTFQSSHLFTPETGWIWSSAAF